MLIAAHNENESVVITCKAILFDLDGVLVDSGECVERTWRKWALAHQLDPERVVEAAHGRRAIETVRLVAPNLSADDELAQLAASESTISEGVYEIAGARALIENLPNGTWAIVTSGIRSVAEFRLRLVGIPIPRVMVCGDEITRGKPDPEGYLQAAKRLGRFSGECLVIEDASPGITAAHAAGMQVIAVAGTYQPEELTSADAVVGKLTDLSVRHDSNDLYVSAKSLFAK
jgi:mannitol-1-/sugar-/sorbitol-6-phosphatase